MLLCGTPQAEDNDEHEQASQADRQDLFPTPANDVPPVDRNEMGRVPTDASRRSRVSFLFHSSFVQGVSRF